MQPRRLPLVAPSAVLTGVAPLAFERAAGRVQAGDERHRGLLRVGIAMARHALLVCAPPSAAKASQAALDVCEAFASGGSDESNVKKARSEAFVALIALERATRDAVRRATEMSPRTEATPLDAHADHVVLRFASLGAHYAGSSVVLCLDAVTKPRELATVPQQAAGALAYSHVGLGPARSAELRRAAWEQAEWEHERELAEEHGVDALALQLFHEFLGVAWKDASDGYRAHLFEFAEWALPPELRTS